MASVAPQRKEKKNKKNPPPHLQHPPDSSPRISSSSSLSLHPYSICHHLHTSEEGRGRAFFVLSPRLLRIGKEVVGWGWVDQLPIVDPKIQPPLPFFFVSAIVWSSKHFSDTFLSPPSSPFQVWRGSLNNLGQYSREHRFPRIKHSKYDKRQRPGHIVRSEEVLRPGSHLHWRVDFQVGFF